MMSELSASCHPCLPKSLSETNTVLEPPEQGSSCHRRIARELPSASHIGKAGLAMGMACAKGFGISILNPARTPHPELCKQYDRLINLSLLSFSKTYFHSLVQQAHSHSQKIISLHLLFFKCYKTKLPLHGGNCRIFQIKVQNYLEDDSFSSNEIYEQHINK